MFGAALVWLVVCVPAMLAQAPDPVVWTFDRLDAIGGFKTTVEGGPTLLGLPLFGLLGFLGAAVAGAWLLISILRSGR